jgi:monovalent cation:H+ antiporter-2, CPA2 family
MINSLPVVSYDIKIVLILAVGFAFASIFGFITQKTKLSPIIGYLAAGYLIGPYSPGFVADITISEELAEIGVILMMFGVGLHFKWQELMNVKNIAIPGAVGQTLIATIAGILLCYSIGWTYEAGIIVGISIGVASTVVLVRILEDNKCLSTPQGHIAVGWLIVEDLITVIALLLLPVLALSIQGEAVSFKEIFIAISIALVKCVALLIIMFAIGFKVVSYIIYNVAKTRSQELFTLTVLALIFVIATGSAFLFGTSIALGAFIAGMVIGQTNMRHQASANALPIKDAFAVVFFLSIGMLFNPKAIVENFPLFVGILSIILIIKPLTAFLIVRLLRKPFAIALTVAVSLAQIGEFSFILSEQAMKLNILPEEGFDILIACALISIGLNPLFFKLSEWFRKSSTGHIGLESPEMADSFQLKAKQAIIVGFGPIGQAVFNTLEQLGYSTVVIDTNVDVVTKLINSHKKAVYGDASLQQILEAAHIDESTILVITSPEISSTLNIVKTAMQLNPTTKILVRANYISDQEQLEIPGVQVICNEEEAKEAFVNALWNTSDPTFASFVQ